MSLPLNQVVVGDCTEVMQTWPADSIDCIVTDPPYGLGFMSKEWDKALPPRAAFEQMIRVLKPGALAFVMSSPRQDVLWRMLAMLEGVGFELRQSFVSWVYKTGFPKAYDVSKGIDKKLGYKPKTVGKQQNFGAMEERTYGEWAREWDETQPASDLAKRWEGWKSQTGLKPAIECILMVNKPRSEPTIVDNMLRWGAGAINVDACRIPFKNGADVPDQSERGADWFSMELEDPFYSPNLSGRFPANLLISDGALDTGKTTKSGILEPHHHISEEHDVYGEYAGRESISSYGDEGSPYRFFDLDAWAEHHGFLDVPKPAQRERGFGLWSFEGQQKEEKCLQYHEGKRRVSGKTVKNVHPTVKPVKLMAYLIELGCPPGGVVVDPFLGSGTTCIAAKRLRRRWIGIELSPEYAEIAEARINIRGPLDQFIMEAPTVE